MLTARSHVHLQVAGRLETASKAGGGGVVGELEHALSVSRACESVPQALQFLSHRQLAEERGRPAGHRDGDGGLGRARGLDGGGRVAIERERERERERETEREIHLFIIIT